MKAEEIAANKLFNSGEQLLIPQWQRRYSWGRTEWAALWIDLQRIVRGEAPGHFLGSVVLQALKWTGRPSEAQRFYVVDGQQRVTTLTVLLAAIRDRTVAGIEDPDRAAAEAAGYTAQLLRNENLRDEHKPRLVLQERDNGLLQAIVEGRVGEMGDAPLEQAYAFFRDRLEGLDLEETESLIPVILARLSAVWVTLEEGDNAHRVFQTLNAGGRPLRQSDLVRNYFFLLLGQDGDTFYRDRWSQLERDFSTSRLDDYLVAWSISQGHNGGKQSLFSYFQLDLQSIEDDGERVFDYGDDFVRHARHFSWTRRPQDADVGVANIPLADLHAWGTQPADGLILHLLRERYAENLDDAALKASLEILLSFMARRMLAGFEPNLHKSIFVSVTKRLRVRRELRDMQVADYLRFLLSQGKDVRTWPSNLVLTRSATEPVYTRARAAWVFMVLERINRAMFSYQPHVPRLLDRGTHSIEHVMPQALTADWLGDLDAWGVENPVAQHATLLHVLGNLTLTPMNSSLSNRRFNVKKQFLIDDSLRLNVDVCAQPVWTESTILERGRRLLALASEAFVSPLSAEEMIASPYNEGRADEVLMDDDVFGDPELIDEMDA